MFERIIKLPAGPLIVGAVAFPLVFLSYVVFAGTTHFLLRVAFRKHFDKYQLSRRQPSRADVYREIRNAVPSLIAYQFTLILVCTGYRAGLLHIYGAVRDHGIVYLLLSIGLLVILNDAYFYWTHRLLHHRALYKRVHLTHHGSINPTPWAAVSFSPAEACVFGLFFPLVTLFMPVHYIAAAVWLFLQTLLNVLGHSGIEVMPRWLSRAGLANNVAHHQLHHEKVHYNYALFFPWWDRIMGTEYPAAARASARADTARHRLVESAPKPEPYSVHLR